MKPNLDGWNILLMGHWDPLILTPSWVGKHVAEGEVSVDLPQAPRLPPRLNFDGVSTLVVDNRLVVTPHSHEEQALDNAESIVIDLLELLPHTPLTGTGVNFQWLLPLDGKVAKVLRPADDGALAALGFSVQSTVVRRKLVHDGHQVNLTAETAEGGQARVGVNFHHDTHSCADAVRVLKGHVRRLRARAEEVVRGVYG